MDQIGSGGLSCAGGGVGYGSVDSSVSPQLQRRDPTAAAAAARQQHEGAPGGAMQPLAYTPQGGPSGTFVRDMGAARVGAYSSLSSAAEPTQYRTSDGMDHFATGSAAAEFRTEAVDAYHGVQDGGTLAPPRPISSDAGIRGARDAHNTAAPPESSAPAACGIPQGPPGGQGSPVQRPVDTTAGPSSTPPPRVGEAPLGESTADTAVEVAPAAGHGGYHDITQDQGGPCGAPLAAGDSQGFGGPRSGIEKYLQWLDAIHTACSKLDDLCSKLDRNFPNATREWDATSPGIRGARQLFQMYADTQPTQQVQHQQDAHAQLAHGTPSSHEDIYHSNPRKRPRKDSSTALGTPGGFQGHQSAGAGLAHEFAGAAMAMSGRGPQHMQQPSSGAMAAMGMGGTYGAPVVDSQGKSVAGGASLAVAIPQQCTTPLPGTANVLPPAGVPTTSLADGGEYEYLLDYPEQEAPDPDNPSDLKCDVAGVYWDKRSWIASWYEGGKRYYKSFSAKTHGFYRSKYWAIKVRLSKVQSHALAGKGCKARATAA